LHNNSASDDFSAPQLGDEPIRICAGILIMLNIK
jgi:hypothetical protein